MILGVATVMSADGYYQQEIVARYAEYTGARHAEHREEEESSEQASARFLDAEP